MTDNIVNDRVYLSGLFLVLRVLHILADLQVRRIPGPVGLLLAPSLFCLFLFIVTAEERE